MKSVLSRQTVRSVGNESGLRIADWKTDGQAPMDKQRRSRERDSISTVCSIEREKTCYPFSQDKDKQVNGEEVQVEGSYNALSWGLVWSQEFTTYPRRAYNDKHVRKDELSLEIPLSVLLLTVKVSRQSTSYPHDEEKSPQYDEKLILAGNLSVFSIDLKATLTNKTQRTEQLLQATDTFNLSANTEITEWLSCKGFAEWEQKTDSEDQQEDNACFRLGVQFSLAL